MTAVIRTDDIVHINNHRVHPVRPSWLGLSHDNSVNQVCRGRTTVINSYSTPIMVRVTSKTEYQTPITVLINRLPAVHTPKPFKIRTLKPKHGKFITSPKNSLKLQQSARRMLQVPTTQLAKVSIDPKFVELTADVLET